MLLLCCSKVPFYELHGTCYKQSEVAWLYHVVVGSCFIGTNLVVLIVECSEHDYWQGSRVAITLQSVYNLVAIHVR